MIEEELMKDGILKFRIENFLHEIYVQMLINSYSSRKIEILKVYKVKKIRFDLYDGEKKEEGKYHICLLKLSQKIGPVIFEILLLPGKKKKHLVYQLCLWTNKAKNTINQKCQNNSLSK